MIGRCRAAPEASTRASWTESKAIEAVDHSHPFLDDFLSRVFPRFKMALPFARATRGSALRSAFALQCRLASTGAFNGPKDAVSPLS